MLKSITGEFGSLPQAALNDAGVLTDLLAWQDKVARTSSEREADNRLSALSSALTWAKRRSKITINHVKGFQRLYHSDRAEIIWLPEHVHSFMAVSPAELQPALILALHSGQREGDLIDLRWTAYDGTLADIGCGHAVDHPYFEDVVTFIFDAAMANSIDDLGQVPRGKSGKVAVIAIPIARVRYTILAERADNWIQFPIEAMTVFEIADDAQAAATMNWLTNFMSFRASPSPPDRSLR